MGVWVCDRETERQTERQRENEGGRQSEKWATQVKTEVEEEGNTSEKTANAYSMRINLHEFTCDRNEILPCCRPYS